MALITEIIQPGERRSKSRIVKGERGIWQRRYWEHVIRDEQDNTRHVDQLHDIPGETSARRTRRRLALFDVSLKYLSAGLGECA
jgi:hypothetical protein